VLQRLISGLRGEAVAHALQPEHGGHPDQTTLPAVQDPDTLQNPVHVPVALPPETPKQALTFAEPPPTTTTIPF
jgi:hypothetical protein